MGWGHADGDETCATCKRELTAGEETHYNSECDKLQCLPCRDMEEDALNYAGEGSDERDRAEILTDEYVDYPLLQDRC